MISMSKITVMWSCRTSSDLRLREEGGAAWIIECPTHIFAGERVSGQHENNCSYLPETNEHSCIVCPFKIGSRRYIDHNCAMSEQHTVANLVEISTSWYKSSSYNQSQTLAAVILLHLCSHKTQECEISMLFQHCMQYNATISNAYTVDYCRTAHPFWRLQFG